MLKLLKSVSRIEVKRCFVISDYAKRLPFKKAKYKVLRMAESELDRIIKRKHPRRLKDYNAFQWYVGTFSTSSVGVWKKAGGLPLLWTIGSVADTARLVQTALRDESPLLKKRARNAIPNILKNKNVLAQKEKYLFPIVTPGGSYRRNGMKKLRGDLDDGCMRAIALSLSGKKKIRAFIGKAV